MSLVGIIGVMLKRLETAAFPTVSERIKSRSSDFQLISFRPFLNVDNNGRVLVDYNKRYVFNARIKDRGDEDLTGKWANESYGCADDIAMLASILSYNIEVIANGSPKTVKAALLEASRTLEAEKVSHIVFRYMIQEYKGVNAIVLKNLVAPHDATKILVITLDVDPRDLSPSGLLLA
jgi:hypothetical protein